MKVALLILITVTALAAHMVTGAVADLTVAKAESIATQVAGF